MTPGEAIERGADYLVIGRPINKPPNQSGLPKTPSNPSRLKWHTRSANAWTPALGRKTNAMMNEEELALAWFNAGIFLDKSRSPQGKGFRLKLHEKNPDAPLSPFYMNFRLLRSFPELLVDTAWLLVEMMERKNVAFDLVADVTEQQPLRWLR